MLYCCLDGKHVKYAWNSRPRGWGGWEMECIFLSAKRDHLLSASPLILIKEFIELRCFSKRIEGHALILFLEKVEMMMLPSCSHCCLKVGKKKKQEQRKKKKNTLPAPSSQAWWQGVFINSVCAPMPSLNTTWNSAQAVREQHILLALQLSQKLVLGSFWGKEWSTAEDSAVSYCIWNDRSLKSMTRASRALSFPLYTLAYFWGGCGRDWGKWIWVAWRSLHTFKNF